MRAYFFAMLFLGIILPCCSACGGGESSYKDRQGEVDPANAPIDSPEQPGQPAR